MKRWFLRGVLVALVIIGLLGTVSVAAYMPYGDSYVYTDKEKTESIPIADAYDYTRKIQTFNGTDTFQNPADLFIDAQGFLYVADSGNDRIVKLSAQGELQQLYTEAEGLQFRNPTGVFVDAQERIYVADSGNQRIVVLNQSGECIKKFVLPESDLLSDVSEFNPNKLAYSEVTGYLYVIQGKQFMAIAEDNSFVGYVGSTKVPYDFLNYLFRLFATEKQKSKVSKKEPAVYNNFFLSSDNLIYAVTSGKDSQLKVINAVDQNLFPPDNYGEITYTGYMAIYPNFADITLSRECIITTIEANSGRVYQYTTGGDLLATFGGKGDMDGYFNVPVAIDCDANGNVFILDSGKGSIQIFEPTEFIKKVQQAYIAFSNGKYEESFALWDEVSRLDATYPLASTILGNIYERQGDYELAMEKYRLAQDFDGYGTSYDEQLKTIMRDHFTWFAVGFIAVAVCAVWLFLKLKKRAKIYSADLFYKKETGWRFYGKLCLLRIFHPNQVNELLKRERAKLRMWPMLVLLAATMGMRYLYLYLANYSMSHVLPADIQPVLELIKLMVPALAFIICNYGLSTVLSGEAKLRELATSLSYCFIPYIVAMPIMTVVSYLVKSTDAGVYNVVLYIIYGWVALLVFCSVRHANDFTVKQTIGILLLTVVAILLLLVALLLLFTLVSQVIVFVQDFAAELRTLLG